MQDLTASQSLTSPLMLFMHATMPFEHLHKSFIQPGQLISRVEITSYCKGSSYRWVKPQLNKLHTVHRIFTINHQSLHFWMELKTCIGKGTCVGKLWNSGFQTCHWVSEMSCCKPLYGSPLGVSWCVGTQEIMSCHRTYSQKFFTLILHRDVMKGPNNHTSNSYVKTLLTDFWNTSPESTIQALHYWCY